MAFQRALAGAARDLSDVGERAARDSDRQTAIILRQRKIIGCTTTYANAHSRVFQELRPRVIIVEEAAEVLGPLVIGLLPPSVQHLVLIGDHQQLSPRVNDRLVDLHGLSVSEMERLALADTPYSILRVQNRMSHGNSKLLLDRYPFLMDGERTRGVEDPPILQGGPTFWDHCDPEEGHVRNIGEARRVVFLASILLGNGYEASQLAIISPYREQVLSIERMIKREDANHLLREVHVGTVDSFQGEEADVVFISLVRSNLTRKIGFLDNPQRKGVLSSRVRGSNFSSGTITPCPPQRNGHTTFRVSRKSTVSSRTSRSFARTIRTRRATSARPLTSSLAFVPPPLPLSACVC